MLWRLWDLWGPRKNPQDNLVDSVLTLLQADAQITLGVTVIALLEYLHKLVDKPSFKSVA